MIQDQWKIEVYLNEDEFTETLWRSKNGQYQEAQGWYQCADADEAKSKWLNHNSNEKQEPFVIHYSEKDSYWLCWWEFSSESRYLRDRKTSRNVSNSSDKEFQIIYLNI